MANIMKVLSPLTASVGLSVSGSQGLIVTHGSISGSSNLLVGGQITGSSGAKITGEISASTVVGDGSGLTGVAKPSDLTNFATRTEVTGVLGSYATLTGVSASFTTPAQVTGAISSLASRTEVSGGFVAKDGSGNVTITGDLTVQGTTTTVDTTNLLVEDAVIQLGSGSSGNADGDRGLIFSRNSENKAFFWDESDSKFKLAATTTAGNTNTIVAGAAQGLDVGALTATSVSASGDVTAVTGFKGGGGKYLAQLTQSQFNSGPGGIYTVKVSGTAISDAFGNSGDKTALKFRHISSSQGQEYDDVAIQIYDGNTYKSSMAIDGATFSVDIGNVEEEGGGGESSLYIQNASTTILGSGSVVIKARDEGFIKLGEGSNNTLVKYNGSNFAGVKQDEGGGDYYLNLVSTFDALSGALGAGGPTVSPSEYYSLRVSTKGMTQMGSSPGLVQFFLSGSPGTNAFNEGNTNQVTASCPLGLSGSTGDACMANFAYAMFDVAVKNGGASNNLWTNDLVSVQVSASQSGSTGDFYPFITVEGAGLSNGVEIRLIVVNEEREKIS